MREKLIVDDRGLVTITPDRVTRTGHRVLDDGNLKALLDQLTQMRFDTHVCQHPTENDLNDLSLAQLEHRVFV